MEEEKKTKLRLAGVNLDSGVKRFLNNEALYEEFLLKFPSDVNMQILRQAFEAEEKTTAFHAAHTLLGVAANLSMEQLYAALRPATEALRGGNINLAKSYMPSVEKAYLTILEALK
ncbi:MAG: Hpt domain-containing protein [Clostridia bacterium]|nr:Hpt domain-containing protein [Clostridia bacterium]